VDRTRNGRVAAISGIEHRIISKRNVADNRIEEVVWQGRLFKALGKDGCIGIEPLRDACCRAAEFHAGPAGAWRERLGHKPEEMPHTHRRLQNLRVGLHAEPFESFPHTGYHQRRREMRVGSGGARRSVFVRGKQLAQFLGGLFPLPRRMRLKDVCHCAPPAVTRENGFFLAGGLAVISLDLFQCTDRGEVGEGFFAKAALTDPVLCGYSEIAGRFG